ncbi:MAG: hypothetical protein ACK480_17925, partial [Planctomycetota bacterium]
AIGCMSVRSLRRGGVKIDKFCLFGLYGGLPSFATDLSSGPSPNASIQNFASLQGTGTRRTVSIFR